MRMSVLRERKRENKTTNQRLNQPGGGRQKKEKTRLFESEDEGKRETRERGFLLSVKSKAPTVVSLVPFHSPSCSTLFCFFKF